MGVRERRLAGWLFPALSTLRAAPPRNVRCPMLCPTALYTLRPAQPTKAIRPSCNAARFAGAAACAESKPPSSEEPPKSSPFHWLSLCLEG